MTAGPRVGRPALDDDVLRERKRRILDDTLELIATHGATNVRLRDVALATGVSVGTLQHYFDSRDQLIRDAFAQHAYGVIDDVLAPQQPDEPLAAILQLVDRVFSAPDLRLRSLLWVEFVGASRLDVHLRELAAEVWTAWRAPIRAALQQGIEDGSFPADLNVEATVTAMLAIIDGGEVAVALQVETAGTEGIAAQLRAAAAALVGHPQPDAVAGATTGSNSTETSRR